MAVIYSGTFDGLQGHKGISIQYAIGATIGGAVTFQYPFLDTPVIFTVGDTDEHVHAASSATTGFTPTQSSASSSGSGATANWLAIGRGDKNFIRKQWSNELGDFDYGTCAIGTATTFSNGCILEFLSLLLGLQQTKGCISLRTVRQASRQQQLLGQAGQGREQHTLALEPDPIIRL